MYQHNCYFDEEDSLLSNEYLTPWEVMELLRIGKNSLYTLLASGALKAFKVGKLWRISRKAVLEFVQGQ